MAIACGLLGLVPFWALPVSIVVLPGSAELSVVIVAVYAALILSFLGGARWGMALKAPEPDPVALMLAMAPTLFAWGLLIIYHGAERALLFGFAAALGIVGLWDMTSSDTPQWYRRLRLVLTTGAAGGLYVGALLLKR